MKCFLHTDIDPTPKEADNPAEAVALAEYLLQTYNEAKKRELKIKWRRDELYPDNFVVYTHEEIVSALEKEGVVWLQLTKDDAEGLVMGEIVTICSEAVELANSREAQEALKAGTELTQAGTGKMRKIKRRNPSNKKD